MKVLKYVALGFVALALIAASGCAETATEPAKNTAPVKVQGEPAVAEIDAATLVDFTYSPKEVQQIQDLVDTLGYDLAFSAFAEGYGKQSADGPSAREVFDELLNR